jgi:hypothetical protein
MHEQAAISEILIYGASGAIGAAALQRNQVGLPLKCGALLWRHRLCCLRECLDII